MDDKDPWEVTGPSVDSKVPTPEVNDKYLGASILLPRGSSSARGKVISRKRDSDKSYLAVPILTLSRTLEPRTYKVEFPDGEIAELTANAIARAMYSSCDDDGNEYLLFDCIIDHKKNDKALTAETQSMRHKGKESMRRTTAGWSLCVQWLDGSASWQSLKDLKEAYPLEVAEYAVSQGIADDPAFNWWVNFVLKKRERIIKAVKGRQAKYLKTNFKFGIEVPRTSERRTSLTRRMATPCGLTRSRRRWKMSEWLFRYSKTGSRYLLGISRSAVT